jgi:hypothetical protein
MKMPAIVTMRLLFIAAAALAGVRPMRPASAISSPAPQSEGKPAALAQTIIQPGVGVGILKLGDTRARALELFPKKVEDQEWQDACGTTLDWVDASNPMGRGDLTIRLKKGKIFQIDSSTTRFHTVEGITTFDSPEKVASAYKDLHAYVLLTTPLPSLGDRPLIYWLDKKKGIAFAFAYYTEQHKRYLYKIIVFLPNKNFCPETETTSSPNWQEIPAYSLEPPADLAVNRHTE